MAIDAEQVTGRAVGFDLAPFGHVPDDYVAHYRYTTPGEPLVTGGAAFKWYDIFLEGFNVPHDIDQAARELVLADPILNTAPLGHGLGFISAHYTATGTFIGAGVWCNHNELWMSVWWRTYGPDSEFVRVERGELAPILCIFEMGPVCHERMCWHRYLFSARDEAAKQAWLADTMQGAV